MSVHCMTQRRQHPLCAMRATGTKMRRRLVAALVVGLAVVGAQGAPPTWARSRSSDVLNVMAVRGNGVESAMGSGTRMCGL